MTEAQGDARRLIQRRIFQAKKELEKRYGREISLAELGQMVGRRYKGVALPRQSVRQLLLGAMPRARGFDGLTGALASVLHCSRGWIYFGENPPAWAVVDYAADEPLPEMAAPAIAKVRVPADDERPAATLPPDEDEADDIRLPAVSDADLVKRVRGRRPQVTEENRLPVTEWTEEGAEPRTPARRVVGERHHPPPGSGQAATGRRVPAPPASRPSTAHRKPKRGR